MLRTPFVILNSNTPKTKAIANLFLGEDDLQFKDPELIKKLNEFVEQRLNSKDKINYDKIFNQICEEGCLNVSPTNNLIEEFSRQKGISR